MMSPFILLLFIKGLSRMISASKRDGDIKGIKLRSTLSLSHVLFMDDVMLFVLGIKGEENKYK